MEGNFVGKIDNNLWHYNTKHDGLSRKLQCWGVEEVIRVGHYTLKF